MKHFALIGSTLTHSYSKRLFDLQHFADADYRLCPMPSLDGLRLWLERERIAGFNVTNPYKQSIVPLLDELSSEAACIGAVNCVCVNTQATSRTLHLVGHNTDAPAFRQSLESILTAVRLPLASAFILGTGGAARAVAFAMQQMGIFYTFVSRTPHAPNQISYSEFAAFNPQDPVLIVNATPVGTFPEVDRTPLPVLASQFASRRPHILFDLVYNPTPTLLMRHAEACGFTVCDGLEMLRLQARLSWSLWHLPF